MRQGSVLGYEKPSLGEAAELGWQRQSGLWMKAPTCSSPDGCPNELDAAVKQIGRNVTGVQGDVAKLVDIDKLYAAVKEQKGKLDVVFANAGIGELAPIGEITEEIFDKQFDVNVKGVSVYHPEGASTVARQEGRSY